MGGTLLARSSSEVCVWTGSQRTFISHSAFHGREAGQGQRGSLPPAAVRSAGRSAVSWAPWVSRATLASNRPLRGQTQNLREDILLGPTRFVR